MHWNRISCQRAKNVQVTTVKDSLRDGRTSPWGHNISDSRTRCIFLPLPCFHRTSKTAHPLHGYACPIHRPTPRASDQLTAHKRAATSDLCVHTMPFFRKEPLGGPCPRDMKSGKAGALSASSLPVLEPIACFAESRKHCFVMPFCTSCPPSNALTRMQGVLVRLQQAVLLHV